MPISDWSSDVCSSDLRALGENLGRGAESLDRDELADILGVKTGIAQRDIAAHRMRDDRQRAEVELMDQLREIVAEAVHVVIAVGRPGAVAMYAQVGCDDLIAALHLFGVPVPVEIGPASCGVRVCRHVYFPIVAI